jgi:Na+/phosphate symporter
MPGDSYWPLLLAFGLFIFFLGFLPHVTFAEVFTIGIGAVVTGVAILGWLWPNSSEAPE